MDNTVKTIEQVGKSRYYLQFNEDMKVMLQAVQGETGRVYEYEILDDNQSLVKEELELTMVIQTKRGNTKPIEATYISGRYEMLIPQEALYGYGYSTYQIRIKKEDRLLATKVGIFAIERNLDFVAPNGENFYFSFQEFKRKIGLLEELRDSQEKILQEQIKYRDEMLEIYEGIDLAAEVIAKADEINELNELLQKMYSESDVAKINKRFDELGESLQKTDTIAKEAHEDAVKALSRVAFMEPEFYSVREIALQIIYQEETVDGKYIIFHNGTAIFWGRKQEMGIGFGATYGPLWQGSYTWNFPIKFTTPPNVTVGKFQWDTGASWGYPSTTNNLSVKILGLDITPRDKLKYVHMEITVVGLVNIYDFKLV